jgi:hypothetical protein
MPAPGPSPWYLSSPSAQVKIKDGTWNWIDNPNLAGLCHLFSPGDEPVLSVDFYSYVQQVPGERLLIWRESRRQERDLCSNPRIVFDLLSGSNLVPLGDAEAVGREMRARKEHIRYSGGHSYRFDLVSSLDEGRHNITPPPEFSELSEVLVLGDFGPSELRSNHWDRMARAIFAFDFKAGLVEVLPQEWFNKGHYDFGYQWISRVYRDPVSNLILGEGVRLGRFRLDSSGKQIDKWLDRDVLSHPARK